MYHRRNEPPPTCPLAETKAGPGDPLITRPGALLNVSSGKLPGSVRHHRIVVEREEDLRPRGEFRVAIQVRDVAAAGPQSNVLVDRAVHAVAIISAELVPAGDYVLGARIGGEQPVIDRALGLV